MSAFFTALGGLAQDYGLARQGLEESNLRRVQQQTEQTRLKLEQQQLEQQKHYHPLLNIGLPSYVDPITKQLTWQGWDPYEGKITKIPIPGGTAPNDAAREYISQFPDPKDRAYLTDRMQAITIGNPGDPRANFETIQKIGDKLREETQKQAEAGEKADLAFARREQIRQENVEDRRQLRKEQQDARNKIAAPYIKSIQTAAAAKQIYQRMAENAATANQIELSGKGNAGSFDMYLLQNHMTLLSLMTGLARGGGATAGRTQRLIEEHKTARSWQEEIQVMINKVATGSQLSQPQRANFVELAKTVADDTNDDMLMLQRVYQVQSPQLQQQQQQEEQDLINNNQQLDLNQQPTEPQYDPDE